MIRVGIVGYGNLGKGIEKGIANFPDLELTAIFTRRDPASVQSYSRVVALEQISDYQDRVDVLILALGSQKDIPVLAPRLAEHFTLVDCYDNHAEMPRHFSKLNEIAAAHQQVAVIATGWDPGLFSIQRVLADAVLPNAKTYTFWGPGLSQGHSDVVRHIEGVKYGVQYTIPNEEMLQKIRAGEPVDYSSHTAHQREVYIVLEENADAEKVTAEIKAVPDYFAPYQTEVHILSEAEFMAQHQGMPHGGYVIRAGETSAGKKARYEFSLQLDSNPEFTASVSLAFARAAYRLKQEKSFGAKTILDFPLKYVTIKDNQEILEHLI